MFPYDTADWSVVDGPMFMLAGTQWPGIFTAIAAAVSYTHLTLPTIYSV